MSIIENKIKKYSLIFGLFIYLLGAALFIFFNYQHEKELILNTIDSNLKIGAYGTLHILGTDFHEYAVSGSSISSEADLKTIEKLSKYANDAGLKYVYTWIKQNDNLYFTSSSATTDELSTKSYTRYFDIYEEASPKEKNIFSSGEILYEDSTDKWGSFRSILIPVKSKNGTTFVVGADITTDYVKSILDKSIMTSIFIGIFIIIIISPFLFIYIYWTNKDKDILEEEVALRTIEINQINASLEKRIQEEIEKSRQHELLMMKQSGLAAMGEMMGNIAHQWRQPINALNLIIQDLEDAYEYNELDAEYMSSAVLKSKDIISYMSQTINDFRNFFRPDKAKEFFSPHTGIKTALSLLDGAFKANHIEVETIISDDITIEGYPNEYAQVILNILNNAKDVFAERKIHLPKITITLSRSQNQKSLVTIKDNANGIPPAIIEKIFEPYFSTKDKTQGTGLGLYMSKIIIEKNMYGSLTVSNDAEGAIFRIEV